MIFGSLRYSLKQSILAMNLLVIVISLELQVFLPSPSQQLELQMFSLFTVYNWKLIAKPHRKSFLTFSFNDSHFYLYIKFILSSFSTWCFPPLLQYTSSQMLLSLHVNLFIEVFSYRILYSKCFLVDNSFGKTAYSFLSIDRMIELSSKVCMNVLIFLFIHSLISLHKSETSCGFS